MSDTTEIVIYPPAIHARPRQTADGYDIDLFIDTPRGKLRGQLNLPASVIAAALHSDFFTRLLVTSAAAKEKSLEPEHASAAAAIAAGDDVGYRHHQYGHLRGHMRGYGGMFEDNYSAGDDAGFSFHLPNPISIVSHAAQGIVNKAKDAANHLIDTAVPHALKDAAAKALNAIHHAPGIAQAEAAISHAKSLLQTAHLPGGLPLAALSRFGAGALASATILGDKATEDISNAASHMMASLGDEPMLAAEAVGATVSALTKQKAKAIANDADFAREVGIPTLKVQAPLKDAARELIKILRLAYVKDADSLRKIHALKDKAAKGDAEARILWLLAADISNAVHGRKQAPMPKLAAVHSAGAMLVGDGVGEGYGQAGWSPSPSPAYCLIGTLPSVGEREDLLGRLL